MRRRLWGCGAVIVLVAAAAVAPLSSIAGPATLPACTAADLVPRFTKIVVTQGPTSFTRAARGKEAVVRAHLTIPTTCTVARTQSITPTSATLTITGGSASGPIANYNPVSGALGSAALADSTADPLFLVPATALRPGDGSTTSALTLAGGVTYTRVSGGATTTGLTTPAGAAGSTKTLTLDRKTNALRILLIPLGDPASTAVQWDAAANSSAQALMAAAARVFPVQDGWGTLAPGQTGGVRFSINQGLLDVRSLNLYRTASGQTKFCSNGSSFATSQVTSGPFATLTFKGQLQQTLADYNAANPTQRADVALGVIKDDFAWPTNNSVGLVCDDGRAVTPVAGAPGAVGWVRLSTTNAYPTPGLMEIAHNLGIQRLIPGVNTSFHSLNVEADIGAPDQGYNVVHRKVLRTGGTLGNDHSVMNYNFSSIPYTNDNILAESDTWNDFQCNLRPPSASDPVTCGTIATSVGTSDGVAAGSDIFGIDGTYDGTTGVVRVTNSRLIAQADPDAVADPASILKLRFLNGTSCASPGAQLAEFGVPILGDEGHAEEFETGAPSGFHVNVPFPAGTTVVQLRIGADVKYCRAAQPGDVPDVSNVTPGTSADTGTLLRSFPLPQPSGGTQVNGRAIAFDGRDLWATFGPNSSNAMDGKLYKVTTTGTLLRTDNISTPLGALAYDADRGTLYGGHYDLANRKPQLAGNVYEITTGTSPSVTKLFRYPFTGGTTYAGGDPKAINGLEDVAGGFALSADLAKQAFVTTRLGADVSSFSTVAAGADCNSGIARDHEGLWLASLATTGSTTFVHTSNTGAPDGVRFTVPGYRAQDIEFDDVTFAPKCALWANQATSTVPQVRAYQVPCAIGAGFKFSANAPDLVGTAYFTCGRPGDPLVSDCVEPPRHRPDRRYLHLYVHLLRAALVRRRIAQDLGDGEQRHLREPAHGHQRQHPGRPLLEVPHRGDRRSVRRCDLRRRHHDSLLRDGARSRRRRAHRSGTDVVPGRRPPGTERDDLRSDRAGAGDAYGDTARDRRPRPYLRDVGDDSGRRGHVGTAAVADAAYPQRQSALEHDASSHPTRRRRSRRAGLAHLLRGLDAALVQALRPGSDDPQRAAPSLDRRDPADLVHGDRHRRQPDDLQRFHPHRHDGAAPHSHRLAEPGRAQCDRDGERERLRRDVRRRLAKLRASRDEHRRHFHRHVHRNRCRREHENRDGNVQRRVCVGHLPRRAEPRDTAAGERGWVERVQAIQHGRREVPCVRRERLGDRRRGCRHTAEPEHASLGLHRAVALADADDTRTRSLHEVADGRNRERAGRRDNTGYELPLERLGYAMALQSRDEER